MPLPSWYKPALGLGCLIAIPILFSACDTCTQFACDPTLGDVGGKARDVATFLSVQRGDEAANGNTVLAQGGASGRAGAVAISLRAHPTTRLTPLTDGVHPQVTGATSSDFATATAGAYTVGIDAAIGLTRGWHAGDTRIGAIDFTGSVTRLARYRTNALNVIPDDNLIAGAGIRVGIVQESVTLPAISFSFNARSLGSFSFQSPAMVASDGRSMSISGEEIDGSMSSVRLSASKRFGKLGGSAGIGTDNYYGNGTLRVLQSQPGSGVTTSASEADRWTVQRKHSFMGASYDLGRATIGAELVHLGGGKGFSGNTFSGRPISAGRTQFSVGVRLDLRPSDESANAGTRTRMP